MVESQVVLRVGPTACRTLQVVEDSVLVAAAVTSQVVVLAVATACRIFQVVLDSVLVVAARERQVVERAKPTACRTFHDVDRPPVTTIARVLSQVDERVSVVIGATGNARNAKDFQAESAAPVVVWTKPTRWPVRSTGSVIV